MITGADWRHWFVLRLFVKCDFLSGKSDLKDVKMPEEMQWFMGLLEWLIGLWRYVGSGDLCCQRRLPFLFIVRVYLKPIGTKAANF